VNIVAPRESSMNRDEMAERVSARLGPWDMAIVGGGATGVGIAVDAASRGYRVVLLEQSDFGKGTSSRSTKLIHGGVRYLQQGNVTLVMESLKERGILRQNAPHLVHDLAFVVPNYLWWEAPFYGIGMKVYDLLAGRYGFGPSAVLTREQVIEHIPTLEQEGLRGGVLYHDGQFDDSRLLVNLVQTAAEHGACLLNYAKVERLTRDQDGFVDGLVFRDMVSGRDHALGARCVVNAAGPFCDSVRRLDDPTAQPIIAPSQGVHVVLERSFLPGDAAIMVPRTEDGRVMFAIPWLDHALVGTTDTPVREATLEPKPMAAEVDFLLETAARYLSRPPTRHDVLSAFAGIRPLVRSAHVEQTASLSREHTIEISRTGLITIAGGKWTTYRRMAQDCVDHAATLARLADRPCVTHELRIHGYHTDARQFGALSEYGSDAVALRSIADRTPDLARRLHDSLPMCGAQVVWAVREEMALTVDDVLARRTRALQLDARAAVDMAPEVAVLMAAELGEGEDWQREQVAQFERIAAGYVPR
jgi:glycerol-3-phosphate dehydrogenase